VDIDGHAERFGRGEDVPKLLIVEVLAVSVRVDDRALETELRHGTFELPRRRSRRLRRDRRKPREAIGARAHGGR
jgi:hypothetical protein